MKNHPQTFVLVCLLGLALGACSEHDSTSPETTPVVDAGTPSEPATPADSGTPTLPTSDAGTTISSKAIPLIDWVDDLVDHHTDETSLPDTVDDKNIADNEDPTTFDKRF